MKIMSTITERKDLEDLQMKMHYIQHKFNVLILSLKKLHQNIQYALIPIKKTIEYFNNNKYVSTKKAF